jgi:hypothetical protein
MEFYAVRDAKKKKKKKKKKQASFGIRGGGCQAGPSTLDILSLDDAFW